MMIDMEDASYVDRTIQLYCRLREQHFPVAITLQTYLYRTTHDLDDICQQQAMIRLVKGAFAGDGSIAWTKKADIDASYVRLIEKILQPEMRVRRIYPIIATHDHEIIEYTIDLIRKHGWKPDEYEFEMLMGVREPLQTQLAGEGHPVRVYVPYGTDWWAYTARRIGEKPANLRFVARAVLGGS